MKKLKKIIASICAVAVFCPALSVFAEFSEQQKNCPDFSQIKTETFDSQNFDNAVSELNKIANHTSLFSKSKDVKKYLETLTEEYARISTIANVYDINYNGNITDSSLNKNYSEIQQTYLDKYNEMTQCIENLYNSGYYDELENINGCNIAEIFLSEEFDDMSDEEYEAMLSKNNQLITEINNTVSDYYSYTDDDFSVDYNGKTWTLNDLLDYPPYNDDDYEAIAKLIHDKRNNILGNIYLKLLKQRQQIAELYGYDNYAEYAYENLYIRDYSMEETDKTYELVKKYFSDNYEDICDLANSSCYFSGLSDMSYSSSEVLDIVADFLEQADYEFYERFEHLKSKHLYDLSDDNIKSGDSFMSSLYSYSVPYVFISPTGDYDDILSMVHEFGHANAEYAKPASAIESELGISLDTSEMHSQGMEILFTHYSEQLLGEEMGNSLNQIIIYDMIDSIIQGCLFDEFQKYAYQTPNCTLEDLNKKYEELCLEYGIEYSDSDPYLYDWVEISHNYDSPMYYITYATSAVSVLDLWLQSMNDMNTSINMYKKVTACDTYTPYEETIKSCGLATIFDENALAEIAYQTEYYFDHGDIDPDYSAPVNDESSLIPTESTDSNFLGEVTLHHNEHHNEPRASENTTYSTYENEPEKSSMIIIAIIGMFAPFAVVGVIILIGVTITIIAIRHYEKKKKDDNL